MAKVEVYTVDYCPYCRKAKAILDAKGVQYSEIDITDDPMMREKLVELSEGRTTVPQIFINGKCIGGSSDLESLKSSGELDILLSQEQ